MAQRVLTALAAAWQQVIGVNSADYTAWEYRWRCLQALGAGRAEELAFMQAIADVNPKNYQLWNHRRKFALLHGAPHAHQVPFSGPPPL